MFDHIDPYLIAASTSTSFIAFNGDKHPSDNISIHKGYTCEETGETPIKGPMHFWKDEENKWHYLSAQGYEKRKDTLPNAVFAIKYPISDIESKVWPQISKDLFKEQKRESATYISKCTAEDKSLPNVEVGEKGILLRGAYDLDPLIFYRLTHELKEDAELPSINLQDYYPLSDNKGIIVEITPNFNFDKNEDIINKNIENFKELSELIQKFPKQCDNELKEVVEKHI